MGVIVAVAVASAGCVEEPAPALGPSVYPAMAGAHIATVGVPGPQDIPFGEALVGFSHQVGGIHAFDERADEEIQQAVLQLATVLERMPAAAFEPELRRAAARIRAAEESAEPSIEDTRRALAVAATALLRLARRAYCDKPEVLAAARAFAGAVSALDGERGPPDRAGEIVALLRAERVLAAMYAANVMPPRPG